MNSERCLSGFVSRLLCLITLISLLSSSAIFAAMDDSGSGGATCAEGSLRGWICKQFAGPESETFKPLQLNGGLQLLHVGNTTDAAPAVGMVYHAQSSPWSIEGGAFLPHDVPGAFQTTDHTQTATTAFGEPLTNGMAAIHASISKLWELHLTGQYTLPHGQQTWVVPHAGLGVSLMRITNHVKTITTGTQTSGSETFSVFIPSDDNEVVYSWSPLAVAGLTFFDGSPLNVRVDASYAGYADTFTSSNQLYDLGFSGWMLRTLLQVRF